MSAQLRRAGRGRQRDGSLVTWSIAEGRRGRRWREVVTGPEGVVLSLLLETDPERRFAHMELSTPAGLLTLHPEGDGTLHGNAVTADGIHHVRALPWDADGFVIVERSSVCLDAAIHHLRSLVRSASTERRPYVGIRLKLAPLDHGLLPVKRTADDRWFFDGDELRPTSPEGLPVLEDADDWPLEDD